MTTINDRTNGKLFDALIEARKMGNKTLSICLKRLMTADRNMGTETTVTVDFAPLSFEFYREKDGQFKGNGGIIFHGRHDRYGDGGAPTFSVHIGEPFVGWSIHT